jgi:hypothetical protein
MVRMSVDNNAINQKVMPSLVYFLGSFLSNLMVDKIEILSKNLQSKTHFTNIT